MTSVEPRECYISGGNLKFTSVVRLRLSSESKLVPVYAALSRVGITRSVYTGVACTICVLVF